MEKEMYLIFSKLFLNKDSFYIALILIALGGAYYVLDDWHYKPLRVQEDTVTMLSTQLNECINAKDTCEANVSKQTVEVYQKAISEGDYDEKDFNFDLDNLTT